LFCCGCTTNKYINGYVVLCLAYASTRSSSITISQSSSASLQCSESPLYVVSSQHTIHGCDFINFDNFEILREKERHYEYRSFNAVTVASSFVVLQLLQRGDGGIIILREKERHYSCFNAVTVASSFERKREALQLLQRGDGGIIICCAGESSGRRLDLGWTHDVVWLMWSMK
jgi:hypothetical protein